MRKLILKDKKGVSLIELVVVLSIIGILAAIGIPQYSLYVAKSRAREAATDLLQNMRLARTMAIKENRTYLMTFNEGGSNNYRVGFDGDSDGSLLTAGVDGYGSGEIRITDFLNKYGNSVVLDLDLFTTPLPQGPNGIVVENTSSFQFLPDGSISPNGALFMQHTNNGFTTCLEMVNTTGKINIYSWQGNKDDPTNPLWTELR